MSFSRFCGRKGKPVPDWLVEVIKQQAPSTLTALLVAYFLGKYIIAQHKAHLASKEEEIKRLVKERDKLQDHLLKQRLSTEEDGKKTRGKT